ncbi:hypothetical protein Tco_1344235 [Tanacetum coccineum]
MDLMNRVCKPYLDKFVIVFTNDIFIYSSRNKDCEEHLRHISELLKNKELYANFSKCDFWLPKVQFLGHVVDSQDIHVDTAKRTIIRQKEKVIAHDSLQLTVHEKNYTTHDLEFGEIVLTLKIWEHYRYDVSMNSNPIITGIRSKDLGTQSCLTTQQNLKASLELPDLILNAIFHHLPHKLSHELLPFVDFYSGDIVSRNALTLHIPSPSVIVVVVMFAVVGSVRIRQKSQENRQKRTQESEEHKRSQGFKAEAKKSQLWSSFSQRKSNLDQQKSTTRRQKS